MKLYNFTKLIKKYSVDFTLVQIQDGAYISGRWVAGGEVKTEMRGAIVPLSDRKVYSSGGTYTSQDRQLFLTKPLNGSLSAFRVIHNKNTYAVEDGRNFEDYADVAVYTLKWVSKE